MPAGVLMAKLGVVDTLTPRIAVAKKAILGLGTIATAGIGAGLVSGISKATGAFIDFQAALNNVQAVSLATNEQMEALSAQAQEMGATTKFSARQAAEAQSFLAMAGLEVNQVMGALPGTLNLAAAGALDLGTAADLATNIMSGMQLGVTDLGRVSDVMASIAASANTNVLQLGEAMKFAAPVASAAGVSIETTAAAIGVLSNRGSQGSMAGTSLARALVRLNKSTGPSADALAELGVKTKDAQGNMRPLHAVIEDLGGALLGAGGKAEQMSIAMKIGGDRGGRALLNLVSGIDELKDLEAAMDTAGGAATRMATTQQKGLVGVKTQFVSAVDGMWIALGQRLEPAMTVIITKATEVARGIITWAQKSESAKRIVDGLVGVVTHGGEVFRVLADMAVVAGVGIGGFKATTILTTAATKAFHLVGVATAATINLLKGGFSAAALAQKAWTLATKGATIATKALSLAVKATPIGWIATAVGLAATAWGLWGDTIKEWLTGAWNRFVGVLELALPLLGRLGSVIGIEMPDSLDSWKIGLQEADDSLKETAGVTLPAYAGSVGEAREQLRQAQQGFFNMEMAGQKLDKATIEWRDGLKAHITTLSDQANQALVNGELTTDLTNKNNDLEAALASVEGQLPGVAEEMTGVAAESEQAAQTVDEFIESLFQLQRETEEAAARQAEFIDGMVDMGLLHPPPINIEVEFPDAGLMKHEVGKLLDVGLKAPLDANSKECAEYLDATVGPTWGGKLINGLSTTFSPSNVSKTISDAFTGGGGMMGAVKALGTQLGGVLGEALQDELGKLGGKLSSVLGPLGKALGSFLPGLGPVMMQGAVALGKKIWGGLKRMFGGPSEAVQAARQSMEAFAATINADSVNQDRLADWIKGGFSKSHAIIVTHFQDLAIANGKASQAGVDLWLRYQKAVEDGNQGAIDAVMAQLEAWGVTAEQAEAAAEAALEYQGKLDGIKRSLLGLPTEQAVADFDALREVWDSLSPEERAQAAGNYTQALRDAAAAGIELTDAEKAWLANADAADAAAEAATAAAEAARQHGEAVEEWGRKLQGLPTDEVIAGVAALREAWDNLTPEQRAMAMDAYVDALQRASDAGVELTAVEQRLLDNAAAERHAEQVQAAFASLTNSLVSSYQQMRASAEEMANASKAAMDKMVGSLAGGYMQMRDAAQKAYDEAEAAALESGATQEAAALAGQQAWEQSYEEQKALKIRQLGEEAAFAAALKAIQEGNAAGAAAAAHHAYTQTTQAATTAFTAIEGAHAAMTLGIEGNYDQQVADHAASADEIYERQKADKIRQMAEEAAFTAALKAIQEGRASSAVTEARRAYGEMTTAAGAAFTAIEQANELMEGAVSDNFEAMGRSAGTEAGKAQASWEDADSAIGDDVRDTTTQAGADQKIVSDASKTESQNTLMVWRKSNAAVLYDARAKAHEAARSIMSAWYGAMYSMRSQAHGAARSINAALDSIRRNVSVTITTTHHTVYTSSGSPGSGGGGGGGGSATSSWVPHRQHGGRVRKGQDVMVGERGREIFRPGASGTIIPNRRVESAIGGSREVKLTVTIDGRMRQGTPLVRAISEAVAEDLPEVLEEKGYTA